MDTWLIGVGEMVLLAPDGRGLRFPGPSLVCAEDPGAQPLTLPCPSERVDELAAVRSWLAGNGRQIRVERCDQPLFEPVDGGRQIAVLLALAREVQLPPVSRESTTSLSRRLSWPRSSSRRSSSCDAGLRWNPQQPPNHGAGSAPGLREAQPTTDNVHTRRGARSNLASSELHSDPVDHCASSPATASVSRAVSPPPAGEAPRR